MGSASHQPRVDDRGLSPSLAGWQAVVDLGIIVTGVVGLAGIGGTLWQGKRAREAASKDVKASLDAASRNLITSINAENERALRAEKRRIYAAHLAACTEVHRARIKVGSQATTDKPTARLELMAAGAAVVAATAEVSLVAPEEVSNLAESAAREAGKFKSDAANNYFSVRSQLVAAMRADLGEPD
jgi:hypothetical protein